MYKKTVIKWHTRQDSTQTNKLIIKHIVIRGRGCKEVSLRWCTVGVDDA